MKKILYGLLGCIGVGLGAVGAIVISFVSGLVGMILDQFPVVLILHRAVSIVLVFFLAIHVFVFHKKLHK